MMTNLLNGAHVANKLFSTIARLRLLLVMFLTLTVSANAWGAEYELVTSAPSDWSGEYLIVAGTSALSGGTSSWGTTTTVTVSNNKISTEANISVTISKGGTSGTYYIYMNSNSKYLKEVTSNTFATADAGSTETEWKISLNQDNAQIECASATARYLRLNGTSGYRCYTSATGTLPKLYKKVTSASSYTVTLNAGSGTCAASVTETSAGAGVTLPTANPPAACATDGWKFAGWWTGSVAETTTSPGELLAAGSNYKPTTNCTLYAVYSHTEAGGGGSGFYLSVTKDATTYYIGEKGSGSFLSAVTDVNSAATFNIENNQYLYYGNKTYVSSTANSTSLTIATTTPSTTWTITDEGETITFKSNGTGGRYLAFNYNNGSPRFSSYGSTYTYKLTKHTTSTTTYNSNPDCGTTETSRCVTPKMRG